MNYRLKTLTSVIALASLVACNSADQNINSSQASPQADFVENDPAIAAASNASLSGIPDRAASYDLIVTDVTSDDIFTNTGTVSFSFVVSDTGGATVPFDELSIALEVAASGNFNDAYRLPLFDLRASTRLAGGYTARSAPVDLPAGNYQARLVVNPNWQNRFDLASVEHSHTMPFRYFSERDYSNNASAAFQATVVSDIGCTEDAFEDNDNQAGAQPIPVGGQIDAALCLDDVDIYSLLMDANGSTALAFHYNDTNDKRQNQTKYMVLDTSFTPMTAPLVAKNAHKISIDATNAGAYYVAFMGSRAGYTLNRFSGATGLGLADDFVDTSIFVHGSNIDGPHSWLLGDITLQKLAFTEQKLMNQTVNCGRITTQYRDDVPVAYVTPQHFANVHEFRFLGNGQYLVDGETKSGWTVSNDDISNNNWYENEYPGYGERVSDNRWRYWTTDGLAYVECAIEL